MEAVLAGRLLVAESQLKELADAYGVSYAWLLTGKPEHWTPSMETSWSSRLRFFRVSIGGFQALREADESPVEAESTIENLEQIFFDGEQSDSEAESLLKGINGIDIVGMIGALRALYTNWSNNIIQDFPYNLSGLALDKPIFKQGKCPASPVE